jgi:hypothetical protein
MQQQINNADRPPEASDLFSASRGPHQWQRLRPLVPVLSRTSKLRKARIIVLKKAPLPHSEIWLQNRHSLCFLPVILISQLFLCCLFVASFWFSIKGHFYYDYESFAFPSITPPTPYTRA